ncbi:hypothetical protein HUE46_08430 [Flavobacterium columnare]|uniref:Nucleoside 2-deoxyribosyltransferase n=2 Tax=Flavobacterium columnare TaxID=996 RepID=G8XAS8_FLACA|nr:nucleoside 2-deoxyribosyltransferase domain-containing protein [Flavobacterium columnare]AEW87384.1 hypothetical protein FCOL_12945 [Flavobacterium columnare ATCC 49512]AMO21463.2 hypothetical protein UN65_08115 [Flavobacterium columnare]ANO49548.1 hypothetical protein Pf1_01303 [Flavobacterium columnare]APT22496.1 hypothetical protein BU993_07610 [Flavobacterium columnare]AUX18268.1 hypothetical protein AQ623_08260 [Flavobacterium columnare]
MKTIYKSPEEISKRDKNKPSIFLAGSIEMNKAIDWQSNCEEKLSDQYTIFNPRRKSWDSSWEQKIENPDFKAQVLWELNALEESDIIIMYFAEDTKSPISLLEFGLYAKSKKMKVVVDKAFWRKGNIDIVCEKYGIEQFDNLDILINSLIKRNQIKENQEVL